MTSAQFMIEYVRKWGWLNISTIFHDNGAVTEPFTTGGFICASPSAEQLFAINTIDIENSSFVVTTYFAAPPKSLDFEQVVSCYPFECLQRFDTFLHGQQQDFDPDEIDKKGKFPIPTRLTKDQIMAYTPGDDGLIPGTDTQVLLSGEEVSVADLYPEENRSDRNYRGMRILNCQQFYRNQDYFKTAMKEFFDLNDLI